MSILSVVLERSIITSIGSENELESNSHANFFGSIVFHYRTVRVVTPGLLDNVCFEEHPAQREGICSFADIKQLTILRFSFRIVFILIRNVATIAMKAFQ